MVIQPDMIIQSPQGRAIAIVEVKNRQNFSRDVATEFRRNMVVHGLLSHVPYFLLTSQDIGYLWKNAVDENLEVPPMYEFPMENVVKRYVQKEPDERLYGGVLDLVVQQWLSDLTRGISKNLDEPEKTLAQAGFSDSIKGARVIAGEV